MIGSILSGDGGRRGLWVVGLAVAAGVFGWLWLGTRSGMPSLGAPTSPYATIQIVEPSGALLSPPVRFEWKPVPDAASYQVRIADADAVWPLFVRSVDGAVLLLDPGESKALGPGRIHEWTVEARNADGAPIATGEARFRVLVPGAEAP